jgi:hypothetical protein
MRLAVTAEVHSGLAGGDSLNVDSPLMGTCSRLATNLDVAMLLRNGVKAIYPPGTPLAAMEADFPNGVPFLPDHLGSRFLIRYLRASQVGGPLAGTEHETYVTPTPYSPEETVSWLALPFPLQPRTHVILLDPVHVTDSLPDGTPRRVFGPRWVQFGGGLEYILERGYPETAIVGVAVGKTKYNWELQVT